MTGSYSRREFLASLGAALTYNATNGSIAAAEAQIARGLVCASGSRARRAQGLSGVLVSNGRDVVVTRGDGSWELPVQIGDHIFVIKPSDFAVSGSFHWHHAEAAAIPNQILFDLAPAPEPQRFQALLLTDTQPDCEEELGFVRDDIIVGLKCHPAAFAIHHGDVVGDALHLYPEYKELLSSTGIPWHHCAGNHDIDREAPNDASSRQTWKQVFGPRRYAFRYAQAVFFVLDNVEYLGREQGSYRGAFGPEQLAFVRNVLAHVPKDHLVVLSMHIPLRCYLAPDDASDTTVDWVELLRLLDGRPHTVSFSGHLHATEHHYLRMPGSDPSRGAHHHHVLTAASGSWWSGPRDERGIPCADSTDGTPNGFHVLTVDGAAYATEFVAAGQSRQAPLRACIENGRLLVNVFDGGPRTVVSARVGDGTWKALRREVLRDPATCRLLGGSNPRKPWVEATSSSHIWSGDIVPAYRPVPHQTAIRITDEYGRVREHHVHCWNMDESG